MNGIKISPKKLGAFTNMSRSAASMGPKVDANNLKKSDLGIVPLGKNLTKNADKSGKSTTKTMPGKR